MDIIKKIFATKSRSKDGRRREFILYILLSFSIVIVATALCINATKAIFYPEEGISFSNPASLAVCLAIFFAIFAITKKGYQKFAGMIYIAICLAPTVFMTAKWGIDLPQTLLFYVLIIVMSGILINSAFSFFITAIIGIFFYALYYLFTLGEYHPDMSWQSNNGHTADITVYLLTFLSVAIVSWLSNREMEKSLHRARQSEAALKKERDSLEVKVEERTQELKKAQVEKMTQLYRFAEFGRLSSGIFHDMINPMTAVSLNLEKLKDAEQKEVTSARSHLSQAFTAAKRMEDFVISLRRQLQREESKSTFSLTEEIIQSLQILSYRARKAGADILFPPLTKNITTHGDAIRFSQVVMNLVSNAIDSYDNMDRDDKKVEVNLTEKDGHAIFTVRDHGCGIKEDTLAKIFDPFFTTKSGSHDKGMGIGLSSVKNIVEKDLAGQITVDSQVGAGTKFTVVFPIKHDAES